MRCRAFIAALIAMPMIAHADDPRDLFGLAKAPASGSGSAAAIDCSDGLAFGCAGATDAIAAATSPYALSTWLPTSYLETLPIADSTHDQLASYALGAGADPAGVVAGGATGAENRWTIDGAPADDVRTGAAGTAIPVVFLDGILVTTGGFAARDRASTGGVIDAQLKTAGATQQVEAYAWLGQAAPAARAAVGGYQLRTDSVATGPTAAAAVVASGPLAALDVGGGHAWYVAGIAPELASAQTTWTSQRLVGAGSGAGAGETAEIDQQRVRDYPYDVPAIARLGWDRGAQHVDVSVVGAESHSTTYLANSAIAAAGVDHAALSGDAIATYRGAWRDTTARVQLAWHHSRDDESAATATAAGTPQTLSAYVPANFGEPGIVAGCALGATPTFQPCPISSSALLASGGAGLLTHTLADRVAFTAEVAHRFGAHTVRVGVTDEDARLDSRAHFTGGELVVSPAPGDTEVLRFADPSAPSIHTRYAAAYIEDTFALSPHWTADAGLRWELDSIAGPAGDALAFHSEPAPRLGLAWDPLGHGRTRIWTSMGRQYALLAAGLGDTVVGTQAITTNGVATAGTALPVAADIEPLYQDELTAGAELAYPGALRLTTWVQARYLRRGFDTALGEFVNPGSPADPAQPEALRDTQVVAVEIATAPGASLALRAGYSYTRAVGSWTGAYDPRQGFALFAGSDFDTDARNQYGALPTDLRHQLYVEAGRRGHLAGIDVGATTRFTIASGAARDALADTDEGVVELLPRGSDGDNALAAQVNVRLSARWRRGELTLDLFDLFDQRTATEISTIYTSGHQSVQPIDGGSEQDLVWLRTTAGAIATRDPGFHLPIAFAPPFSAVLAARYSF